MREKLPFVVECKDRDPGSYEAIAAFNVQIIAENYARDCYKSRRDNHYRVTTRGKTLLIFPDC